MRLRQSVAAALCALVATPGCLLSGRPDAAAEPARGPMLVVSVTNRSAENVFLEYEHEAALTSGGGGGEVPCGNAVMEFGEVTGTYRIMVADDEVYSGRVPSGADPTAFLVVQLDIAEDGSTTVGGPNLMVRAPPMRPMRSCP